ncbi:hypothetical protein AHAS_Ahas11G0084200 [Arachis hypogaea]
MGYCPPSQYDSSRYPNDGWEYHQELTDSEQPNQWGYASEPQDEQDYSMRYYPPPQDDLGHSPHGGWEYQQRMREYEQSSERNYFPEPQSDSYCYDTHTNYGWEGNFNDSYSNHSEALSLDYAVNTYIEDCSPMPQSGPHCDEFNNYPSCGWEDQNQREFNSSYSTYQEPSSLEHTFNLFMQNFPTSPPSCSSENSSSLDYAPTQSFLQDPYNSFHQLQNSFHNSQNSLHIPQNNFTTTHPCPQNYSQPSSLELAEDLLQKSRELLERQEQSWKRQQILFKKMDGHLEQIRRNLELSNIEDEDQLVGEEVEEQEKEVPVSR